MKLLSMETRDAIITLVRKEQTTLFGDIQEKLRMLQSDVDYINVQIKEIFTAIPRHAGGQVIDMEVPDALRLMLDKTDYATKTLAVHEARLQESEGFLQELACLQREVAAQVRVDFPSREATTDSKREQRLSEMESILKTRLEAHMFTGKEDANDVRLRKIESELSELQGQLSRDHTLISTYGEYLQEFAMSNEHGEYSKAKSSSAVSPLCSEPRRVRHETKPLEGDQGYEIDNDMSTLCDIEDGSSKVRSKATLGLTLDAPIQHEPWLAELEAQYIRKDELGGAPTFGVDDCKGDDSHRGAVHTSQIQLEERAQPLQPHENKDGRADEQPVSSQMPPKDPVADGKGAKQKESSRFHMPRWMTPWRESKKKGEKLAGA